MLKLIDEVADTDVAPWTAEAKPEFWFDVWMPEKSFEPEALFAPVDRLNEAFALPSPPEPPEPPEAPVPSPKVTPTPDTEFFRS